MGVSDDFNYSEDPLSTKWWKGVGAGDDAYATGTRGRQDQLDALASYSMWNFKTTVGDSDQDVSASWWYNVANPYMGQSQLYARLPSASSWTDWYRWVVDIGRTSATGRELRKRVSSSQTVIASMAGPGKQAGEYEARLVVDDSDGEFNLRGYDRLPGNPWTDRLDANDSDVPSGDYAGMGFSIAAGPELGNMEIDDWAANAHACTPTPTPTVSGPTPTPTSTPTVSGPTPTPTSTPTSTPTVSGPTPTPTVSGPTPSPTGTPTVSGPTPTATATPTVSGPTPSPTATPTVSGPTPTPTPSPTPTPTPTPTPPRSFACVIS